ncbi:hypothetical protein V6N12_067664 [Hibiscus sabdariffa]|uniref:Uncharacterized protein n=1 Tax=Hibiscus sabdariffa TaxID=183260 RepID=A0ABR2B7R5_9ROSI
MRQRLTMPLGRKEMSMRVEMIETISLIVQVFGHSEKHYKADVPLQVVCDQGVVASSVAVEIPLPVSVLGKVKVASTDNRVGLPAIVQGQTLDDCKVGSSVEPLVATVVEVVRTVPGDKGGDAPDVSSEAVDLVDLGHGPGSIW